MSFTTLPGSGSAATTLSGTSGVDTVTISRETTSNIFIGQQQSADVVTFDGNIARSNFTIKGGTGDDVVNFGGTTLASSFLNGNADADTFGAAANGARLTDSTLKGGQGQDGIFVTSAEDSIVNGNKGTDTITVVDSVSNSSIHGGIGADTIALGNSSVINSLVKGDKGNDTVTLAINEAAGRTFTNSTVQGGEGNDTLNGVTSTTYLLLAGGSGADSIAGGTNTDTLNGGAGADSIQGNAGADILSGGDNDDNFVYTATADLFAGNALVDVLDGGTGTDSIAINNNGGATFTIAAADAFTSRFSGIETIRAYGATDQVITVTLGDTSFETGLRTVDLSADTTATGTNVVNVSAETGTNNGYIVTGAAGIDSIDGGAGTDTLSGGAANDTITGNGGADRMTGGAGANDFVMTNAIVGAAVNQDTITDFVVANTDQVGGYSATNIETLGTLTNLVEITSTTTAIGAEAVTVSAATNIGAAIDLDTLGANTNLLLISGDYADTTAVNTAIATNVTNGTTAFNANTGFLVAFDDGTDTTIALVTTAATEAAGAAFAATTTTAITTLAGLADATTLANGNFLDFVA